jgi:hypothetical protein
MRPASAAPNRDSTVASRRAHGRFLPPRGCAHSLKLPLAASARLAIRWLRERLRRRKLLLRGRTPSALASERRYPWRQHPAGVFRRKKKWADPSTGLPSAMPGTGRAGEMLVLPSVAAFHAGFARCLCVCVARPFIACASDANAAGSISATAREFSVVLCAS